ncbi:Co-chaperone Hsc20 [Xylaria telfairii]|nr:Co-chaperone Hsc20 [Xylaria telfairii]
MWSSIFPPRLTTRVCAFCRQHQQQQRITTTRNFHASSTRQYSVPCISRSQKSIPHAHTSVKRRPFTNSALAQGAQPATETEAEAEAGTEAAAAAVAAAKARGKVPQTHYEFFPKTLPDGPPPGGRFAIDVRALRREFLELQAGAHPDLHPAAMKARAQATSARINEAFRTLGSPLARAQYLLAQRGADVANDETAKVEDPALLLLVLETREAIEEAEEEADLAPLAADNDARIADCERALETFFAADDLDAAKAEAVRLRYWVNIRESINNWEKGKPVVLEH